jgi:hypothetical protein
VDTYDVAEQMACDAIRLASDPVSDRPASNYKEAWVEAKIAHGEALMSRAATLKDTSDRKSRVEEALKNFKQARETGADNPKVAAVCELHAAQAHLMQGSISNAWTQYSVWHDTLRQDVQHGFVMNLADAVRKQLDDESAFFVSRDFLGHKGEEFARIEERQGRGLSDRELQRRRRAFFFDGPLDGLARFIIGQAVALKGSKAEAAAFLGIDEATARRRKQKARGGKKEREEDSSPAQARDADVPRT